MEKEKLLPKIGRYPFTAEPFHCDFSNQLFLGHLGNAMLNAADFHSNDRSYGMNYLNTINKTWVLSRLAIEVNDMPRAYDKLFIETWVDGAMRYFTSRNFKVVGEDGNVFGYGRSIWAMIDTVSRQPVDILAIHDGLIAEYIDKDYPCPIRKASRVPIIPEDTTFARSIDTYYNDVDVNGHINSVKYIEHVLDLWPLEWYKEFRLKRFEIAYVAESHHGDKLNLRTQEIEGNEKERNFNILITKEGKENEKEVEVVRCNVNFVKD